MISSQGLTPVDNDALLAARVARRLLGESDRTTPGPFGKKVRTLGDVHRAFASQQAAYLGDRPGINGYVGIPLASDGRSLWSYGWYELARWIIGPYGPICITRTGKLYSVSTVRHMRLLEATPRYPAGSETGQHDARMQL